MSRLAFKASKSRDGHDLARADTTTSPSRGGEIRGLEKKKKKAHDNSLARGSRASAIRESSGARRLFVVDVVVRATSDRFQNFQDRLRASRLTLFYDYPGAIVIFASLLLFVSTRDMRVEKKKEKQPPFSRREKYLFRQISIFL